MELAAKRAIVAACGGGLALTVAVLAWREALRLQVRDAALVAALAVRRELEEHPAANVDASGRAALVDAKRASVSPLWFDATGSPVDAWGTPFRFTADPARPPAWVRCESAGRDRRFGTKDDVVGEATAR